MAFLATRVNSEIDLRLHEAAERKQVVKRPEIKFTSLTQCLSRNLGKGTLIGTSTLLAVTVLKALIARVSGRKSKESLLTQLLDRWHFDGGLSLGALLAGFNGTMHLIRYQMISSSAVLDHYQGCVAGVIASLSIVLTPDHWHPSIALFFAMRSLEILGKMLVDKRLLPNIADADVFVMGTASAQILWAWVFEPHHLDRTYNMFLTTHGQKPRLVIDSLRNMSWGLVVDWPGLAKVWADKKFLSAAPTAAMAPGAAFWALMMAGQGGKNDSLLQHTVRFWVEGFKLALPVYIPVFFGSSLVFSLKRVMKAPLVQLMRLSTGIAQSSAFLATYCTMGLTFTLASHKLGFRHSSLGKWASANIVVAGFIAGEWAPSAVISPDPYIH
jgi:hypothetical protein